MQGDNDADKEKGVKEWNNVVDKILQILVSCFNEELRDTYLTTTVEQVNEELQLRVQNKNRPGPYSELLCGGDVIK